mgnify:CR=1 FL=1
MYDTTALPPATAALKEELERLALCGEIRLFEPRCASAVPPICW